MTSTRRVAGKVLEHQRQQALTLMIMAVNTWAPEYGARRSAGRAWRLVAAAKVALVEITPAAPIAMRSEHLLAAGMSDEANAQSAARFLPLGAFCNSEALGWLAYTGRQWTVEGADGRCLIGGGHPDRAHQNSLFARAL